MYAICESKDVANYFYLFDCLQPRTVNQLSKQDVYAFDF